MKDPVRVMSGGQAMVYISRWSNPPGRAAPSAGHFADGELVAFKHLIQKRGGRFLGIETEGQCKMAGKCASEERHQRVAGRRVGCKQASQAYPC